MTFKKTETRHVWDQANIFLSWCEVFPKSSWLQDKILDSFESSLIGCLNFALKQPASMTHGLCVGTVLPFFFGSLEDSNWYLWCVITRQKQWVLQWFHNICTNQCGSVHRHTHQQTSIKYSLYGGTLLKVNS